jgi:uncharacterized protein (DUF4415 family)
MSGKAKTRKKPVYEYEGVVFKRKKDMLSVMRADRDGIEIEGPSLDPKDHKIPISIRLDGDVLQGIKALSEKMNGGKYQSLINDLLRGIVFLANKELAVTALQTLSKLQAREALRSQIDSLSEQLSMPKKTTKRQSA